MAADRLTTVLIIEDEPIFRLNYRTVIEGKGYHVIEAHTGQKGLDLMKSQNPDLVLLDLILPEVNGYEVLKKIREIDVEMPVIVFSVMSSETDMKRAYDLGANAYVIKGMESPTAILEKMNVLLRGESK